MHDVLTVSSIISIPQSKEEENNCSTTASNFVSMADRSGLEGTVKTKVINSLFVI